MNNNGDLTPVTLAETDGFIVWMAKDEDGETTYNLELGNVTLHFFKEEWDELVQLIKLAAQK